MRNKVKSEIIKYTQQEQHTIAVECKRNPKGFWTYVNKNTKAKTTIGDLKWCNSSRDIVLA